MQATAPSAQPYQSVYCLFCRTGREQLLIETIRQQHGCEAFSPVRLKTEYHQGDWTKRQIRMLPGYIFVYAPEPFDIDRLSFLDGLLRILKYADGGHPLHGKDRAFADFIHRSNGQIGLSKAVLVGSRVTITEGPLKSLEGLITAVDKRKRIARVTLNLCGTQNHTWLSFDWV